MIIIILQFIFDCNWGVRSNRTQVPKIAQSPWKTATLAKCISQPNNIIYHCFGTGSSFSAFSARLLFIVFWIAHFSVSEVLKYRRTSQSQTFYLLSIPYYKYLIFSLPLFLRFIVCFRVTVKCIHGLTGMSFRFKVVQYYFYCKDFAYIDYFQHLESSSQQ